MHCTTQDVSGCEPIEKRILDKISTKTEGTALCKTKSKIDGTFEFPSVPSGYYTLVCALTTYVSLKDMALCLVISVK